MWLQNKAAATVIVDAGPLRVMSTLLASGPTDAPAATTEEHRPPTAWVAPDNTIAEESIVVLSQHRSAEERVARSANAELP